MNAPVPTRPAPGAGSASPPPPPPERPAPRWRLSARQAQALLDLAGLLLLAPLAALPPLAAGAPAITALAWVALWGAGQFTACFALGLHRREALVDLRLALSRVPAAAALGAVGATLATWLLPPPTPDAGLSLFAAAVLSGVLAGWLSRFALAGLRRLGLFRRRVLIVGAGRRAWDLWWLVQNEGRAGAYEVAFVHGPAMGELDPRLEEKGMPPVFPATLGFLEAARRFDAEQIVVAADERRGLAMSALLTCRTSGYPVVEYMRFVEREMARIDVKRIELGWLVYAEGFRMTPLDRFLKRALDVAVSGTLLVLLAPVLLLAAAAVKLSDGGPALYRQKRVTRGGREFEILKLRTMGVAAESGGARWAAPRDPRVTPIGRWLRRTRVDELPQLLNILRGDMAFVGPRPERPEFTRELAEQLPLYDERHRVKAGLTGWAQVNYPYGASLDDARSKLSYDLYYVKNQSVVFDLLIILQTLRVVLWPGTGVR